MAVTPVKRIGEYVRDFDDDFLTVALFVENQALCLGEKIGKGCYGTVYVSMSSKTGDFAAIKQLHLSKIPESHIPFVNKEVSFLKNLKHPNVVLLLDVIRQGDTLNVVFEYVENGSLSDIVRKYGPLSEAVAAKFIRQILSGVSYLHDNKIVHRDIKGSNILITKDGIAKVADFGMAENLGDSVAATTYQGSPYWMAPEVVTSQHATYASDVWAIGCTLLEMLTGAPPFFDLPPLQALFRIANLEDIPPIPDNISPACRNFLEACLQRDPARRPLCKDLLRHAWLRQGNDSPKSLQFLTRTSESKESQSSNAEHSSTRHSLRDSTSSELLEQEIQTLKDDTIHEKVLTELELYLQMSDEKQESNSKKIREENIILVKSFKTQLRRCLSEKQRAISITCSLQDKLSSKSKELEEVTRKLHHLEKLLKRTNDLALNLQRQNSFILQTVDTLESFFATKYSDPKVATKKLALALNMGDISASTLTAQYKSSASRRQPITVNPNSNAPLLCAQILRLEGNSWVERYAIVKNRFVFVYTNGKDRVPMHIIALKTSVHVEVAEKLHATNRKVFHFAGETFATDSLEDWVWALKTMAEIWGMNFTENIPTHVEYQPRADVPDLRNAGTALFDLIIDQKNKV